MWAKRKPFEALWTAISSTPGQPVNEPYSWENWIKVSHSLFSKFYLFYAVYTNLRNRIWNEHYLFIFKLSPSFFLSFHSFATCISLNRRHAYKTYLYNVMLEAIPLLFPWCAFRFLTLSHHIRIIYRSHYWNFMLAKKRRKEVQRENRLVCDSELPYVFEKFIWRCTHRNIDKYSKQGSKNESHFHRIHFQFLMTELCSFFDSLRLPSFFCNTSLLIPVLASISTYPFSFWSDTMPSLQLKCCIRSGTNNNINTSMHISPQLKNSYKEKKVIGSTFLFQ